MRLLLACLLLGAASPALADAADSFRQGQWPAVITQGRAEATAAGLVLAGRAQLAIAAYQVRDKAKALELVGAAEKDFDAALAKAPNSVDAQMQKAVAIGYRAKLTKSPGVAKDARRRFEVVRAAHPDLALAWSAIAGWHGGAIATLGGFMAGIAVGAKSSEVDAGYLRAIKLDPGNPVYRTLYALTLLDLDKNNAAKAAQALQGIGQMATHDGFEVMIRGQGVQLQAALKAGDAGAAQVLAHRLQAFGTLG
jgi:hypothetical protein